MAHTYKYLYRLPTNELRLFTVYGVWGCPDMVYFKFTQEILVGKAIDVFNYGKMYQDFTDIDAVVEVIVCLIDKIPHSNE